MKAYPYDVELKIGNPNTLEGRVETRRVYAYNVSDAIMQALIEACATAGSADVKCLRVGPPHEMCVTPLDELMAAFPKNRMVKP